MAAREWITSVPTNKILACGGDQKKFLHACAAALSARDNVSLAVAAEVDEGGLSEEAALQTAKDLLRENPWHYFKLEDRWAARHVEPGASST